jgi:uncharacterized protein
MGENLLSPEPHADEVKTEDVTFFSGPGLRLAARIYLPDEKNNRAAGIVFCHGFGGKKEGAPPGLSKLLARHGYTVFTFDYRGIGASEGPAGHFVQTEQVEDTVNAIEYFAHNTGINPRKMGIYGTSFGGGIALLAAKRSGRPRAAFVTVPVTSGDRWLKSMNRYYEYQDIKARAFQAIANKTISGQLERVDRFEIMVPDPRTRARPVDTLSLTLETFYHVSVHDPLAEAHEIHIPVGIIGIRGDVLVPVEQATLLYDRLPGPKHIHIFDEGDHHSVYGELLPEVAIRTIAWFDQYLND